MKMILHNNFEQLKIREYQNISRCLMIPQKYFKWCHALIILLRTLLM